jgi:hypothetical protein
MAGLAAVLNQEPALQHDVLGDREELAVRTSGALFAQASSGTSP